MERAQLPLVPTSYLHLLPADVRLMVADRYADMSEAQAQASYNADVKPHIDRWTKTWRHPLYRNPYAQDMVDQRNRAAERYEPAQTAHNASVNVNRGVMRAITSGNI
jgi:hypothetical protein